MLVLVAASGSMETLKLGAGVGWGVVHQFAKGSGLESLQLVIKMLTLSSLSIHSRQLVVLNITVKLYIYI